MFYNKVHSDTGFPHCLILKDGAVPAIKIPVMTRIAAFGDTLWSCARYDSHCSCVAMLNLQVFTEVLKAGTLATSPSRRILIDFLFAFAEVKFILCPASVPTFVILHGIIQYVGRPVTVVVSMHLTNASNLKSRAATCVHVSAIPAIHVQWQEVIAPDELMMAHGLSGVSLRRCECKTCRQQRGKKSWMFVKQRTMLVVYYVWITDDVIKKINIWKGLLDNYIIQNSDSSFSV